MSQDPGTGAPVDRLSRPRRPPQSPSRRQPHKNWYFNPADKIERQMQAAGYDTWGFVIYRTTYSSDADWEEFLRRLRFRMERSFDRCNGRDILDVFTLTIFSDPALFDGADTNAIRVHFSQWSDDAVRSERPPPLSQARTQNLSNKERSTRPTISGRSARYDFCIQVDEASLRSIVYDAPIPPAPDASKAGWVKLINKCWVPIERDPLARPGWQAASTYEPIDTVTERDIGWMKVSYWKVMMEYYYEGEGLNGWRSDYCRPPAVG